MSEARRSSDRREQIIAAAELVFDAEGYGAATMAAVAAQAGVAKGSLYNYFGSKRDLFTQVCVATLAGGRTELERLVDEPIPAVTKIQRIIDSWFQRLEDYKRLGRLILEFWATAARQKRRGELTAAVENLASQGEDQVQAIVRQGIASGEFAADIQAEVFGSLFTSLLRGIIVESIFLGLEVDGNFVVELKRNVLAGLGARGTGPGEAPSEMAGS